MSRTSASWRRPWRLAAILITLTLAASLLPISAQAKNPNPRVLPPHSSAYGLTYSEWNSRWVQWAFAQPVDVNPLLAEGEMDCGVGQSGHVWFLAGNLGGISNRSCTIPSGTPLFFPVANAPWVTLPWEKYEEEEIRATLEFILDAFMAGTLFAEVDGAPVENLARYHAISPETFYVAVPEDNVFDVIYAPADIPAVAASESLASGIYLMLAPLPPGEHTLRFGADVPALGFALDVTYHLTVVPRGRNQSDSSAADDDASWSAAITGPSEIFLPLAVISQVAAPSTDAPIVEPSPCTGPGLILFPSSPDALICAQH
jgi:hypothetical protein